MFEKTKAKIRLRRICKALGVEPYPEMVRYVIDRDETIFRGGRRNGKTLTLIIDELVYIFSSATLGYASIAASPALSSTTRQNSRRGTSTIRLLRWARIISKQYAGRVTR